VAEFNVLITSAGLRAIGDNLSDLTELRIYSSSGVNTSILEDFSSKLKN
jgi:hypothetical protein